MIKSNYTDDWRLLNKLDVDWLYTQEEVYTALEQEDYTGNDRAYCSNPTNPILKDILASVTKHATSLLTELCEQSQFKDDLWHLESTEQMTSNVSTHCTFVRDAPGFSMSTHIDSRMTVCTGMLFFNKNDVEEQATTFYTSLDSEDPIRISSQYGSGWYAANTHYSWHVGGNASSRNRYSLIIISKLNLN